MPSRSHAIKRWTSVLAAVGAFDAETLSDDRVLTIEDAQLLGLDPGGSARNVDLPAVGDKHEGYFFVIANTADAAEALTVRKTGAGATVATLSQNEGCVVHVTSGDWALAFGFGTAQV